MPWLLHASFSWALVSARHPWSVRPAAKPQTPWWHSSPLAALSVMRFPTSARGTALSERIKRTQPIGILLIAVSQQAWKVNLEVHEKSKWSLVNLQALCWVCKSKFGLGVHLGIVGALSIDRFVLLIQEALQSSFNSQKLALIDYNLQVFL